MEARKEPVFARAIGANQCSSPGSEEKSNALRSNYDDQVLCAIAHRRRKSRVATHTSTITTNNHNLLYGCAQSNCKQMCRSADKTRQYCAPSALHRRSMKLVNQTIYWERVITIRGQQVVNYWFQIDLFCTDIHSTLMLLVDASFSKN